MICNGYFDDRKEIIFRIDASRRCINADVMGYAENSDHRYDNGKSEAAATGASNRARVLRRPNRVHLGAEPFLRVVGTRHRNAQAFRRLPLLGAGSWLGSLCLGHVANHCL